MNNLKTQAYLLGYLCNGTGQQKEAIDWFGGGNKNPLNWGADLGGAVDDAKNTAGKAYDFVKDPEKAITSAVQPKIDKYENKITDFAETAKADAKKAVMGATAANAAATVGTGLMRNMSDDKRHKEILQALRNRTINKNKTPSGAMRLSGGSRRR